MATRHEPDGCGVRLSRARLDRFPHVLWADAAWGDQVAFDPVVALCRRCAARCPLGGKGDAGRHDEERGFPSARVVCDAGCRRRCLNSVPPDTPGGTGDHVGEGRMP
jgi:hypothetical protein